jgi:succinyl-diaminopimelate desuccinylase
VSNYSRLIEILEKLVSFRTVEGNFEAFVHCLDYCEQILKPHGLHINRYSSNGIPSLIATSRPTKKPALLLQAHLDVLPARDDMFEITGEGKKLVGRGAIDMKYAAACFLHLVEELGERCEEFDFGIMFTMDEETDGLNGVEYLLDQGYGAVVCFLPDGGNNWQVESSAKGYWRLKVLSYGTSAHASRPWLGNNPISKLMSFLQDAQTLTSEDPKTGTTVVPTIIKAGTGANQIPDEAEAFLDVRYATEAALKSVQNKLDALGKKYDVDVLTGFIGENLQHDINQPAFKEWSRIIKDVHGKAPGYMLSVAASDARHFMLHGITTLVTRPKGGGLHGPDEWIEEADLYEFYECTKIYVEKMSATPAITP